jgi:hypothetical protein
MQTAAMGSSDPAAVVPDATGPTGIVPDDVELAVEDPELDDAVRCAACDHGVTRAAWAIEVGGAHVATFRNPAGWSFRVACYRDAPGCSAHGEPTDEASWFPGHAWNLACCGGCGRHLGWWFLGPDAFAGLVLTRLR